QEEAYLAGAGEVRIIYEDPIAQHANYKYEAEEWLVSVPKYLIEMTKDEQKRGCAYLHIDSDLPGLMNDIDPKRISQASAARRKAMKPYRAYTMNNIGQWSIVAVPNQAWAKKVFPKETAENAAKLLWKAILKSVYVTASNDPVEVWKQHSAEIKKHCKMMDRYAFSSLHFTNSIGTDLTVGLPKGHLWGGGSEYGSLSKCYFNANMPTEEVFTTPDRMHVDGIVYASKPLSILGRMIEDFSLVFKDGKAVSYKARRGSEALAEILSADENANRLGEVALISYDSPISRMNMLFYDTLFDENASCHLALGASYPTQLKNGADMSDTELMKHGGNVSSVHVDFMFGTRDMKVIGMTEKGKEVIVFDNGNFVF
ncbi:MAG: aminopeptidase, partial [Erysipelotrichia bacterium]|nr:aminopeptidase [Erysipelotrichia bacterium]